MEIYLELQEELSYHQTTKLLAKVCQLFKLYFLMIQKLVCKYHVEVESIIYGKNLVVHIDFITNFFLLERSIAFFLKFVIC